MKNIKHPVQEEFVNHGYSFDNSDVSTSEFIKDTQITEEEKAQAWQEFEAEMRELDYENNY